MRAQVRDQSSLTPKHAKRLSFVLADGAPIDAQGRQVFVNPSTGAYIVRAIDPRTPGAWEMFDASLN
jgi:hypothetical protein